MSLGGRCPAERRTMLGLCCRATVLTAVPFTDVRHLPPPRTPVTLPTGRNSDRSLEPL